MQKLFGKREKLVLKYFTHQEKDERLVAQEILGLSESDSSNSLSFSFIGKALQMHSTAIFSYRHVEGSIRMNKLIKESFGE